MIQYNIPILRKFLRSKTYVSHTYQVPTCNYDPLVYSNAVKTISLNIQNKRIKGIWYYFLFYFKTCDQYQEIYIYIYILQATVSAGLSDTHIGYIVFESPFIELVYYMFRLKREKNLLDRYNAITQ